MEFIPLIVRFTSVFLELVDEVTHPVHFHTLYALSYKVYYEPSDLCQTVLSDDLARYKLASEAH